MRVCKSVSTNDDMSTSQPAFVLHALSTQLGHHCLPGRVAVARGVPVLHHQHATQTCYTRTNSQNPTAARCWQHGSNLLEQRHPVMNASRHTLLSRGQPHQFGHEVTSCFACTLHKCRRCSLPLTTSVHAGSMLHHDMQQL